MTVQERILALRLISRQERDPDCMKRLGVAVRLEHRPPLCQIEEGENQNVIGKARCPVY